MKNILYSIFIIAAIVGCGTVDTGRSKKEFTSTVKNDTIRIVNDSLEYEVIIIEPGFNAWLATQPAKGYLTQSSMEIVNLMKVNEYNLRVQNPVRYGLHLYPYRIEYYNNIDYGYEVNFMLYNYFLFFEQKYNQRLR
jgi:hypothetical protein